MTPEELSALPLHHQIRLLRTARGWSQREFARRLQCSPSYLNDIEFGRRDPPPQTLCHLASVLGIEPDAWLWLWAVRQMGEGNALRAAAYGVAGVLDGGG